MRGEGKRFCCIMMDKGVIAVYCQLQSIVAELNKQFPVETFGILSGPVQAIEQLPSEDRLHFEDNVLYIASQGDMAMLSGRRDLCRYPILFTAEQLNARLSQTLLSMRALIWVKSADQTAVMVALTEIMYRLGNKHAFFPESYWVLMTSADLEELLNRAWRLMNVPMLAADPNLRVIAAPTSGDTNLLLERLEEVGGMPNLAQVLTPERCVGVSWQFGMELHDYQIDSAFFIRSIPVVLRGETKGYLLLPSHDLSFSQEDMQTCTIICRFALPYLHSNSLISPLYSSVERFLEMVLNSQIGGAADIQLWLERYHWKPKPFIYTLVFSAFGVPLCKSPQELQHEVGTLLNDARGLVYQNGIVILYESDEELNAETLDYRLFPIKPLMVRYQLYCGISKYISSLEQLPKVYYLARKSIDLGRMFEPENRIYFYERCAVYHILESAAKEMDLEETITPRLQLLERTSPELMETLEVYMKNGCNLTQCAKQLFLHVNTVKYRLNQILDILQCDLKDGDTFCGVFMSLKIKHFMKKTEESQII